MAVDGTGVEKDGPRGYGRSWFARFWRAGAVGMRRRTVGWNIARGGQGVGWEVGVGGV